jgi:hypothetical protein
VWVRARGVDVTESILNVRSRNERALFPVHAVVMMALAFGNVVPTVIVIVMRVQYYGCELMQQRHEGLDSRWQTRRKRS